MILITGAGGFIGSNILEEINKLNEKTVIIDDFDNKHKWDFIKEDSFFKYYNISELDSALKLDYSMIIHMGANNRMLVSYRLDTFFERFLG